MHRNPDRITNGRWKGCGHEVTAYFTCDEPACFAVFYIEYAEFLDTNKDALCVACWRRKNGRESPPSHPGPQGKGIVNKNSSDGIKVPMEEA